MPELAVIKMKRVLLATRLPEVTNMTPVVRLLLREYSLVLLWIVVDVILQLKELFLVNGEH